MKMDWLALARDALIVLLISGLGGMLLQGDGSAVDADSTLTGAIRLLLMAAGFCISGCLFGGRQGRIKHVAFVALLAWIITFGYLFSGGGRVIGHWIFGIWPFIVAAAIGGGASFLIVKGEGGDATPTPTAPDA